MSTESPTVLEQSAAILHRIKRQIANALEIEEELSSMKMEGTHNSFSVAKTAAEIEYMVRLLLRRLEDTQRGYQCQLQKCEERLRRSAKASCETKLYCEYLQQELKAAKNDKKKCEKELDLLTTNYNKQIQTLKTELSNVMITRRNDHDHQRNQEIPSHYKNKPNDMLAKIKLKIINMGNVQIQEPQSCVNTYRKSLHYNLDEIRPISEPTSLLSSPKLQKGKRGDSKKSKGKHRNKSLSNFRLNPSQCQAPTLKVQESRWKRSKSSAQITQRSKTNRK